MAFAMLPFCDSKDIYRESKSATYEWDLFQEPSL